MWRNSLCVLVLSVCTVAAVAQYRAGIQGTVLDPQSTAISGATPTAPGVARNSFWGPRYSSVDLTLGKAFGLPRMRVLGENARIDIRANFYNIFNQTNLVPFRDSQQTIGTL